jgi:hypothetical protein
MAMITLTINDETAGGGLLHTIRVKIDNELSTVREIILSRVRAEVSAYNDKRPEYYQGLVQPVEAEATLNGYKLSRGRFVDIEAQCRSAIEAFERNGYFILIDNIQAEHIDQMILVNSETVVSFVKLTPLVGG